MDYLKKIKDKGVIMSISLGHHKLSKKYLDKLRSEEQNELEKIYFYCEKLTDEYYKLTKKNQKTFEKINSQFIELLDKQINLPDDASSKEFDIINSEMKSLENKYKKLEQSLGLDLIYDELSDCVDRINCYFLQADTLLARDVAINNSSY